MLERLYIQNYALIDTLDISFGKGLNIITGETGAGKSIILGALSLILGQRADSKQLFDAGKKCIIEGLFNVSGHDLKGLFEQHDLDYDEETVIRREFSADGKSRAFINDTPVTLQVLRGFGELLIDIHSQHATLQVAQADFQLLVLDSVANNANLRDDFATVFSAYKWTKKELEEQIKRAEKNAAEIDYKQFLFDELEALNLEKGETSELEEEQSRLENAEEIKSGLLGAVSALTEREGHAEGLLRDALQNLSKTSSYLPSLSEYELRLKSCLIELKDLSSDLEQMADSVNIDEERLSLVQERLGTIYTLQHKHRLTSPDELIDRFEELNREIQVTSEDDAAIERLQMECAQLENKLKALAAQLHEARKKIIPLVCEQVLQTLREVGMPDSQLEIELDPLTFEDYRGDGGDHIRFLFTSNKGQSLQPVGRVASGGELSRLMLSIKTLVAEHSSLPTIIFDEIDTGISGEVALRVGDVLARMGERMQVVVISHLPQIASRGTMHYRVFKQDNNERTHSEMELLDEEGRVLEIAQMLSGANPGSAALDHARSLLDR